MTQVQMIPTRDAAKMVGYTSDYVGKLARENKIQAEQRGRQWFVDAESLKLFSLQAEAEKRERQAQLRQERLKERLQTGVEVKADKAAATLNSSGSLAIAQVLTLVMCGLLLSGMFWVYQKNDILYVPSATAAPVLSVSFP
mgnify:CR=1 FL=1